MGERPGVHLYWEIFDVLESLFDDETKTMLCAIKNYSRYGIIPDFSDNRMLSTLWVIVQQRLDIDAEKYNSICSKRAEAGKKSAEIRASKCQQMLTNANKCQQIQPTTTTTTTTTIKNASKRFFPPTLEEVKAYCLERKNNVEAERFYDYYSANGWVQGKGKPIKDWKACVRTWERGNNFAPTKKTKESISQHWEKVEAGTMPTPEEIEFFKRKAAERK